MKYYIEITLLNNPEINLLRLWSRIFHQIHLGLVEMQDNQGHVAIGLSLPEYVIEEKHSLLGSKLRLLAANDIILNQFDTTKWLSQLRDYVHCTGILRIPEKINGYAIYQREQPKINPERMARRFAKRHDGDYEKALLMYKNKLSREIYTPFIHLKSLSTNNEFCLWIKKTKVHKSSGSLFSCYGLSSSSTVPEF